MRKQKRHQLLHTHSQAWCLLTRENSSQLHQNSGLFSIPPLWGVSTACLWPQEHHGGRQKNMNAVMQKKKKLFICRNIVYCCCWINRGLQLKSGGSAGAEWCHKCLSTVFKGSFVSFVISEINLGYTSYTMEIHLEGSLAVTTDILNH